MEIELSRNCKVSLPDRHHQRVPTAAWQTLTIAISSRDAANTLSVLYILSIFRLFAFTTPNDSAPLSLDLDSAHVSDLTLEFSLVLISPRLPSPNHASQCDLLYAQGIPGGTTSLSKRQRRISRS